MKLIISNVSGVPIYEQIKQQIKAAILSGAYRTKCVSTLGASAQVDAPFSAV